MKPGTFLALLVAVVAGAGLAVWLTGSVRTRRIAGRRQSAPESMEHRAPRPLPAPESVFSITFDAARAFLDSGPNTGEQAAWESEVAALGRSIRADPDRARTLLRDIGRWPDVEAALATADALRSVASPEFTVYLIATAQGGASTTERRAALLGLRGRGAGAASAVASVAARAADLAVRTQAIEELAAPLAARDPELEPLRRALLAPLRRNLSHESPSVRSAVLRTLLEVPAPHGEAIDARVDEMAEHDPRRKIRELATRVASAR